MILVIFKLTVVILLYVPCCVRRAGDLSKSYAKFGRSGASHGEGSKLSLFLGSDKNRPSFAVFCMGSVYANVRNEQILQYNNKLPVLLYY